MFEAILSLCSYEACAIKRCAMLVLVHRATVEKGNNSECVWKVKKLHWSVLGGRAVKLEHICILNILELPPLSLQSLLPSPPLPTLPPTSPPHRHTHTFFPFDYCLKPLYAKMWTSHWLSPVQNLFYTVSYMKILLLWSMDRARMFDAQDQNAAQRCMNGRHLKNTPYIARGYF